MACEMVRENAAIVRNIMDMVSVMVNENNRKMKNAAGSRRKFAMKYIVVLKPMLVRIFNGRSQIIEAADSEKE